MNEKFNNTFIYEDYIDNLNVCDSLVDYFECSDRKVTGQVGRGVDAQFKDSMDLIINPRNKDSCIIEYLHELGKICKKFTEKYEYSSVNQRTWGLNTPFNIQRYYPGQGFHGWHCERSAGSGVVSTRHLVWMTYLNDIEEGGETEFYYQNIKVKPKKGKTLIWPVDWTHIHRGITSPSETKYIVTGWYTYYIPEIDYDTLNNEGVY
jgi:prolyl 4-hydroxylase